MTVTALCLTRNRREFLPRAIACFQKQTYPDRKLLVLADGEDVSDIVPDDPRISLVALKDSERPHTIGAKRNLGCSLIDSEVVMSWDDDDVSLPGRIADQMARLEASGLAVTGYRSLRFTDGEHWYLYDGPPGFSLGTSLCFRRTWWEAHPFVEQQVGEDNDFVTVAHNAGQLATGEAGDLMWAQIHPGNTSQKVICGVSWKVIA